jgi:hypothetical protein
MMEIPLFPLHTVLMPRALLPLHVFEPRYRALLADCLAARSPFGVVCLRAGREVGPGSVRFAAVGTLAEIREVTRDPDGRADIMTVGTARFRLVDVDADRKPYLVGSAVMLPELLGDPARAARLASRVRSRFVRYLDLLQPDEDEASAPGASGGPGPGVAPGGGELPAAGPGRAAEALRRLEEIAARLAPEDDPGALAHVVAGLVQVELPLRQRLLEAETAESRLASLETLLDREIALLARSLAPHVLDPGLLAVRRN